ncbi:Receptor expression-enhancing protein [Meloidogyne graminicola]|uniref:Receptor expression-enhancing protein n=1 Tax=Meloidogyne graminicola TaxID=189291 RepID=A0A8S9ZKC4_9BILA|nr:Receptor expression-enhancing protein [Meloidogyne graminicola]
MSAPPPAPPKKDDAPPPPASGAAPAQPPPAAAATPAPPPPSDPAPPPSRASSDVSSKKKGKGKSAASATGGGGAPSTSPSGASSIVGLRQVEVQNFNDIRPALQKWLSGQDKLFGAAEKSSGLEREKIFYGICGVLSLWLIAGPGGGFICNLIGVAYPVFASILALRSGAKEDDTQWLVYWTTYGTFSLVDSFADRICAYFPLYWLLKAIFLLYLELPQTLGAHNIYVKYLDPAFDKLAK